MKEAITAAEETKFSEFSKNVKDSLESKFRDNQTIKSNADKLTYLDNMKNIFSQIKSNRG